MNYDVSITSTQHDRSQQLTDGNYLPLDRDSAPVPQPAGYRITHRFQHLDFDTDAYDGQTTDSVDVDSWDGIAGTMDRLMLFTGHGHTISFQIDPLFQCVNCGKTTPAGNCEECGKPHEYDGEHICGHCGSIVPTLNPCPACYDRT